MLEKEILKNFCVLALSKGVNLRRGQCVEIVCPTEKREVAYAMAETAYMLGAKDVNVRWEDENFDKIRLTYSSEETLSVYPKWKVLSKEYLIENDYCYVAIDGGDPDAFNEIDSKKIASCSRAKSLALKSFFKKVMENQIRWCVVAVPTEKWAKKVFPNSTNPILDLSLAIEKCMRLDSENPISEWDKHVENLSKRANYLNEKNFEYLLFKNSLGTNAKIFLAKNHVWTSAKEKAKDGVEFIANMPTEEIFTAPHRKYSCGVIKSAMPLCYNGKIIDGISLTLKDGKIVDFSAKTGEDVLKELIFTDKGTCRLGEVALIGKNSPIAKQNVLFYNTLFDENASCHLAIGKAYPTTVKNGDTLTDKELKELGVNDSIEHVDFMIGTEDLSIIGVTEQGEETPLFINGEWII